MACPVDCIALQATQDEHGRRYPEWFRINFSRCIYCGFCEEACPTYAIQLTPDAEMSEYDRRNMVYEKDDLLIERPRQVPRLRLLAGRRRRDRRQGQGRGRARGAARRRPTTCCREGDADAGLFIIAADVAVVATLLAVTAG